MRFIDKTINLGKVYFSVQVVDLFRRDQGLGIGEALWPIFNLDVMTVNNEKTKALGITLTLPVLKLSVAIRK